MSVALHLDSIIAARLARCRGGPIAQSVLSRSLSCGSECKNRGMNPENGQCGHQPDLGHKSIDTRREWQQRRGLSSSSCCAGSVAPEHKPRKIRGRGKVQQLRVAVLGRPARQRRGMPLGTERKKAKRVGFATRWHRQVLRRPDRS